MLSLAQFFNHLLFRWKWKRARRKGRTLRLRLGNVRAFLAGMNDAKIPYVVLRWFDEVPLTAASEAAATQDIDLLVDAARLEDIVRLAANRRGPVKCDLYSPTGRHATAFKKMPYYPPVLADEILANREFHAGAFQVPTPDLHFRSLAFHLVYHKGTASGIPTGTELATDPNPARPYPALLEALGATLKIPLARPYTLLALHDYLKSVAWSMPHDLMVRWPQQHDWMRWLARHEEQLLEPFAKQLPHLMVFLLRADAVEPGMQEKAVELLRSRFRVLKIEPLERAQIRRVMRSVRGGNWMEHGKTQLVEPRVALICYDQNPKPVAADDPLRRKYPFVTNANAFFKNEARDRLNEAFPTKPTRVAIHGSDNAFEAQHYLQAIYGDQHATLCSELAQALRNPT